MVADARADVFRPVAEIRRGWLDLLSGRYSAVLTVRAGGSSRASASACISWKRRTRAPCGSARDDNDDETSR